LPDFDNPVATTGASIHAVVHAISSQGVVYHLLTAPNVQAFTNHCVHPDAIFGKIVLAFDTHGRIALESATCPTN